MMFGNATEPDTQQPSLSDYISGNGSKYLSPMFYDVTINVYFFF